MSCESVFRMFGNLSNGNVSKWSFIHPHFQFLFSISVFQSHISNITIQMKISSEPNANKMQLDSIKVCQPCYETTRESESLSVSTPSSSNTPTHVADRETWVQAPLVDVTFYKGKPKLPNQVVYVAYCIFFFFINFTPGVYRQMRFCLAFKRNKESGLTRLGREKRRHKS